jgi:hypothetical protein
VRARGLGPRPGSLRCDPQPARSQAIGAELH